MRRAELALRLLVIAGVLIWLATGGRFAGDVGRSAATALLFADLLSWLIVVVVELPDYIAESLVELTAIIGLVALLQHLHPLAKPETGEGLAVCFLVFFAIFTLKMGWYWLRRIDLM
jgi:hypothetical protein